jgi:CBS domain-containing protein
MLAKDVMTRDVITITPEMPIVDVANLLLSRKISAVPVVDGEGRLIGIVSEGDLIHRSEIGTEPHHTWWHNFFAGREQQAVEFMKVHGVQARHVMTREVATAREDTPLAEVVDMFDRFGVNRVPIVRDDRLVGIISRSDVLRPLAALKRRSPEADKSDAQIRAELEKVLREAVWATVTSISSSINFEVDGGIVRMTGIVGSEAEREALCIAAEGIPGVKAVQAELALVPREITPI